MSDSPIKFPSNPSSSKDEFPSHHSSEENVSSDDGMSDYSPSWSFEKEDPEDVAADDFDSDVDSPPTKRVRLK